MPDGGHVHTVVIEDLGTMELTVTDVGEARLTSHGMLRLVHDNGQRGGYHVSCRLVRDGDGDWEIDGGLLGFGLSVSAGRYQAPAKTRKRLGKTIMQALDAWLTPTQQRQVRADERAFLSRRLAHAQRSLDEALQDLDDFDMTWQLKPGSNPADTNRIS
jgi:hypothetical protein